VKVRRPPVLDPEFVPSVAWNDAYHHEVAADPASTGIILALARPDGTVYRHETRVLAHHGDNIARNLRYVERLVKLMLWMKGGSRIIVGGHDALAREISARYRPGGSRTFDCDIVGRRVFLEPMSVTSCGLEAVPGERRTAVPLGGHLEGCRIGFDLGGSDRKCAAVIDGRVVHSEEVEWDPYFESDPSYHYDGIMDSLRRAAVHLPRVDAIGGSAAGVYVDNEPRVGSLFRGISEEDFDAQVRPLFRRLREAWGGVPFEVVNDGEVTALAGTLTLGATAPLGIAMGTSLASGFCDAGGHITSRLNELAFVPVDYREDAPADEWSGDRGCGVQYFSQQAVARLAPLAGIELPDEMSFADRLVEVQSLMQRGDDRAERIYQTIGSYLGYSIPWFARWYDLESLLILGRVSSGIGGEIILDTASTIVGDEFPECAGIRLMTPDEHFKRHGQAIAAASLPRVEGRGSS
jgi:predicted NBD/HSP70 family sugar kinase